MFESPIVDEQEWSNGWFYRRMYNIVRERVTTRQVRLYMAACCRTMTEEFFDPRILNAIEAAERCADDPWTETIAGRIQGEFSTHPRPQIPQTGSEGEIGRVIEGAWQLLDEVWDNEWDHEHYRNPRHAIAHAAYLALRDDPRGVWTGGAGNAAEYCARAIDGAGSLLLGQPSNIDTQGICEPEAGVQRAIADLLRDIFGNPFKSVSFSAAWQTSITITLADQMYQSRSFDRMPILADALQDAGCEDDRIMSHCRNQEQVHVRGCWVVDLVLGKS